MWNGPPSDPFIVPAVRVEHFGEAPSHEKMASDFATIVSPEHWARRCGEKMGDDLEIWGAVAEVLILGTRRSDPNDVALKEFRRICPTTTPTTYWIFRRTDIISNDDLYRRLFRCLEACSQDASRLQVEDFAVRSLRHVSQELDMDARDIMNVAFADKGAGKDQCPRRTASSTAAQGEGKSQGKG